MNNLQDNIKRTFESLLEEQGNPGQRVRKRIDIGSPIKLYVARGFPQKTILSLVIWLLRLSQHRLSIPPLSPFLIPGNSTQQVLTCCFSAI